MGLNNKTMKTTTKLAIWSLVVLLAVGFTACKKDDPLSKLTADSLENTAWTINKISEYDDVTKEWKDEVYFSDIVPFFLFQFVKGKIESIPDISPYTLDPATRKLFINGLLGHYIVIGLNSDKLELQIRDRDRKYRHTYKRIPPLQLAKLYGKWEITALQYYNDRRWLDGSFTSGYWIEFNQDGSGKNSKNNNCKYTVSGNIVTIECIYGRSFVVELTNDKLVFIHNYKGTGEKYIKETFKKIK